MESQHSQFTNCTILRFVPGEELFHLVKQLKYFFDLSYLIACRKSYEQSRWLIWPILTSLFTSAQKNAWKSVQQIFEFVAACSVKGWKSNLLITVVFVVLGPWDRCTPLCDFFWVPVISLQVPVISRHLPSILVNSHNFFSFFKSFHHL